MKQANLFNVNGQVAVVTGAASGLGLAFAEVLAENGAHVLLTDINPRTLEEHTERLRTEGCSVESKVVDIADDAALRAAIDGTAAKHGGRLDIVFANAGISSGIGFLMDPDKGSVSELDIKQFRHVLDVNLTANLLTISLASRHMKARKSGSIVVTTSVAGILAEPIVGYGYVASKAGLANAVRQAAIDLAPYNVRVNAIAPGPFLTNIGDGRLHTDPARVKAFADGVPLGRLGDTNEIKGLALLLASPAGSFMTGNVIPIDGGQTATLAGRFRP